MENVGTTLALVWSSLVNSVPAPLVDAARGVDADVSGLIREAWSWVVDATGGDEGDYFRLCILPTGGIAILFWIINTPLLFFNFFPSLNPLERWKIQKGRYEKKERVAWIILCVLFNQGLAMTISVSPQNYQSLKGRGLLSGKEGVPTFSALLWQLLACFILYDVMFFTVHCAMHTKWLYMNIHKVHHRSKVSLGITSAYFHPVDYLLSAVSVLAPPLLVSGHVATLCVWLVVHLMETTNAHMGYDVPFLPSTKDHDFHHSHSYYSSKKYRFVTMGAFFLIPDRIFGTKAPVDEWWAEHPNGMVRKQDIPVEDDRKQD